ncbi:FxLD family lanthipeptide [Saccharopolyspora taberi]|uniref:FxLD family lantipeptide n=1 Tax=Saccharopolyspora taberi TaxID=60895 RepID=A0ABN3VK64_9PSEU
MTAILNAPESSVDTDSDVFDLDVQVLTEKARPQETACQTDDGCGSTCPSACVSAS